MKHRSKAAGIAAICLSVCVSAHAADLDWVNVEAYPDDLISTANGWSAVRMEDSRFLSHRCAADDFTLDVQTRVSEIGFWVVKLGEPEIIAPDWYIYADDADGSPGTFLAGQGAAPYEFEDTGMDNDWFGRLYYISIAIEGVELQAARYFLAFRVFQEYIPGGKNNFGALTTNFAGGESEGWWSFGIAGDGAVNEPWVPMETFNRRTDNEWAFLIRGSDRSIHLADCNCDGEIDFADIDAFVLVLSDEAEYARLYPDCDVRSADTNCDGEQTFDDVDSFSNCLIEGGCECD